ncbi:hypothetical protein ES332_D13G028600v1 [Gossypium tomentosum]|uniref:Uncharacterized protein n=1 Tax=Gossypium tomentosum TaxID=34277 RepID=A0A5D2HTH2_GOSTO|nr:hypothetical protein ES332_D13G028600v1 [Gossypium tomentosum]
MKIISLTSISALLISAIKYQIEQEILSLARIYKLSNFDHTRRFRIQGLRAAR